MPEGSQMPAMALALSKANRRIEDVTALIRCVARFPSAPIRRCLAKPLMENAKAALLLFLFRVVLALIEPLYSIKIFGVTPPLFHNAKRRFGINLFKKGKDS